MSKRNHLSVEERAKIVQSYKILGSIRKVCASLNHPYSTVRYTINRFKETKCNTDRPGRGHFECLSSSDKRVIKLISLRDRKKSVPNITEEFNCSRRKKISETTTRRCLLNWGLKGHVAAKKAFIAETKYCKAASIWKGTCALV